MKHKAHIKKPHMAWWIDHNKNVVITSGGVSVVITEKNDKDMFFIRMAEVAKWANRFQRPVPVIRREIRNMLMIAYQYTKEQK